MKKIKYIITGIILLIVPLVIMIVYDKNQLREYDKYNLLIKIVIDDKEYNIDIKNDGISSKITSDFYDMEVIYKKDSLYFIDKYKRELNIFSTNYNYQNLYSLFREIKINNKIKKYDIDSNLLNKFLKNIYLERVVKKDGTLLINIKNNHIKEAKVFIDDNNYFILNYYTIDEDYRVDTTILNSDIKLEEPNSNGIMGNPEYDPNSKNYKKNYISDNYLALNKVD